MSKNIRQTLIVIVVAIVCLLVLTPNLFASGDVGNAFSGSISSGGSSSFGDFGGAFLGGALSMGNSGYSSSGDFSPFGILITFGIIYILVSRKNSSRVRKVAQNNKNFIVQDDEIVNLIKANDPNFSKYAFITYAKEVLISFQEAMESKDLTSASLICSKKAYEEIKGAIQAPTYFYYQGQEILDVSYKNYNVVENYEFVKVEVFVSLYYYETIDSKEQYGSKYKRVNHVYELEFMRNISMKTPDLATISTTNCPSCGAPNSVSTSGICEFCNNNIQTGDFSFVLNNISLISEKKSIYFKKYHYGRLHAFNREDDVVQEIQLTDKNFELKKFENFAAKTIVDIQEAWEKRDMNLIRKYESEDLFSLHQTQIQEYIDKEEFPKIDGQKILDVHLNKYELDGKYEYLTTIITCKVRVFILDKNGKVVSGNEKLDRKNGYSLRFKRGLGVQTADQSDINNCPNCGAEIELTNQGTCQFCNSNIVCGEHGWVVDSYDAINKV